MTMHIIDDLKDKTVFPESIMVFIILVNHFSTEKP